MRESHDDCVKLESPDPDLHTKTKFMIVVSKFSFSLPEY